ncbi:MAG TPA: 4Fe-4S binding protein [Thermodesulfovibrionales bacterium]|nr:4Fe-4S binding protein [Thermodesulfovibrionales bacterium]
MISQKVNLQTAFKKTNVGTPTVKYPTVIPAPVFHAIQTALPISGQVEKAFSLKSDAGCSEDMNCRGSRVLPVFLLLFFLLAFIFCFSAPVYALRRDMDEMAKNAEIFVMLKYVFVFLGGIAAGAGIGLLFGRKKVVTETDPRVSQVTGLLARAYCQKCGYSGCEEYAAAVVNNPSVPPNLCVPAGQRIAVMVANITGKKDVTWERMFSRIMCQGGRSKAVMKFKYEGVEDCAAALAQGGDKACAFGCLGHGTCARICPTRAISMSEDYLPVVDVAKCTGCRACERVCPTKTIEVLPAAARVLVTCHSKDTGADTKKNCQVGCIACGRCVKICPFDAPYISDNLSRIDTDKCKKCGLCVSSCPTNAIVDFIPKRSKAVVLNNCMGCEICTKVCPVNAASGEPDRKHFIDQKRCTGCGICTSKCLVQAIDGTFNAVEVFQAAAAKKGYGKYLLEKGVVTMDDIISARFFQRRNNLLIGELAKRKGWLTDDQILKITVLQEEFRERFGEIAVREKYLKKEQLDQLLTEQNDSFLHFGEALVKIGAISLEDEIKHLGEFNRLRGVRTEPVSTSEMEESAFAMKGK